MKNTEPRTPISESATPFGSAAREARRHRPLFAIRNPQSAIRNWTRLSALLVPALVPILLALGCARFVSPVAPSPIRPSTHGELAARMDAVYPAPESLYVRLDMTVSRRFLPGRDSLMIQMLSRPPDRVVVEVGQRGLVGGILRLTQVGDDAAALLIKDARHFRGQVGELAERPDLFFGIEPLDLARLLTAGHDAAEILKRPAADDWVLREPTWLRRDWLLETGLGSNRRVQYRIRPRDGLVCEIRLLDAKERWSVRSEFRSYERFGDALFPNRFDIRFRKPAVRARTSVQSLNPTPRPGVADPFSLEPPEGVESGSFREWFDRLAPTR